MATTANTSLPNPKNTKYIDYLERFKKEASYFANEFTASGKPWPRPISPKEKAYENFLAEVVDPSTGDYYFTEENGTAKYVIDMIIRQRNNDGTEWLVSQGDIVASDYFKDEKRFRCDKPEMHIKTIFAHDKILDKNKRIVRQTKGPTGSKEIYELPFTPENADLLWSKKRDGNIQLIVKDQLSSEPHAVERKGFLRPNDYQGAFDLFKTASFEYLYNWEYIQQKDTTNPQQQQQRPPQPQPEIVEEVKPSINTSEIMTVAEIEELTRAKPDTKTKLSKEPEKVK